MVPTFLKNQRLIFKTKNDKYSVFLKEWSWHSGLHVYSSRLRYQHQPVNKELGRSCKLLFYSWVISSFLRTYGKMNINSHTVGAVGVNGSLIVLHNCFYLGKSQAVATDPVGSLEVQVKDIWQFLFRKAKAIVFKGNKNIGSHIGNGYYQSSISLHVFNRIINNVSNHQTNVALVCLIGNGSGGGGKLQANSRSSTGGLHLIYNSLA